MGLDKLWRQRGVQRIKQAQPQALLDLAAGTGDFSIALARALPQTEIVAADLSAGMLTVAAEKVAKLGISNISTQECNALEMPFAEGSFDAITCAFGVRNFSDLVAGYTEMHRILRPHGLVCILELCEPKHPITKALYRFYAFNIIPLLGAMIGQHRAAYSYLPASIRSMTQREDMLSTLNVAGFTKCSYKVFAPGVCAMYTAYKPE